MSEKKLNYFSSLSRRLCRRRNFFDKGLFLTLFNQKEFLVRSSWWFVERIASPAAGSSVNFCTWEWYIYSRSWQLLIQCIANHSWALYSGACEPMLLGMSTNSTWCPLSLVREGNVLARQDLGEEKFNSNLAVGLLAWKNSKNFLARASHVSPKCTNTHQNVQIPCQNVQIPRHGKENVIMIHCRELLVRKQSINFLTGVSGKKKYEFLSRGILARPRHTPTYPAKWCLGINAIYTFYEATAWILRVLLAWVQLLRQLDSRKCQIQAP